MKSIDIKQKHFLKLLEQNPAIIFYNTHELIEKLKNAYQLKWGSNNNQDVTELDNEDDEDEESDSITTDELELLEEYSSKYMEIPVDTYSHEYIEGITELFPAMENNISNYEYLNYAPIIAKATNFAKYKIDAVQYYMTKYGYKPYEVSYISIKDKMDQKLKNTQKLMEDENVKLIVGGVWKKSYTTKDLNINNKNIDITDVNLYSTLFIYDKQLKKIINLDYSASVKHKNFDKFFYDYNVLRSLDQPVTVKSMSTIALDCWANKYLFTTKNKVNFVEIFTCFKSKIDYPKKENRTSKTMFNTICKKLGLPLLYNSTLSTLDYNSDFTFYNLILNNKKTSGTTPKMVDITDEEFDRELENLNIKSADELINFIESNHLHWIQLRDYNSFNDKNTTEYVDFKLYISQLVCAYDEFGPDKELNHTALKAFIFDVEIDDEIDDENDVEKSQNGTSFFNKWWQDSDFLKRTADIDKIINSEKSKKNKIYFTTQIKEDKNLKLEYLKFIFGPKFIPYQHYIFNNFYKTFKQIDVAYDAYYNCANTISTSTKDFDDVKSLENKEARICWYDYEGFMDLYPVIDGTSSYSQIVNQVSVIVTKNGVEESCNNYVKDTLNITIKDMCDLIEKVYADKADYYVVFNKTYENTRNSEIAGYAQTLYKKDNDFKKYIDGKFNNINGFVNIVEYINSHTIDLADFFSKTLDNLKNKLQDASSEYYTFSIKDKQIQSGKLLTNNEFNQDEYLPLLRATKLINIPKLMGFHSIKKIEKLITESGLKLKNMIIPYHELDQIQNGMQAMEKAVQRHLGTISDSVWNNVIVPRLKAYCENDVRAMLMVWDFISEILKTVS
ncbi:UU173 family protein [Mycoplasma corogypsi]|uniref:UU173 family protein n=1 Tax=Mycoplasma corogypsi TaxID=2106 RepID=UPI0038737E82